jgi:hypothetical protein
MGLWRKGTRDRIPKFLSRFEELAPAIKAGLMLRQLFVAPIDCERRLRRRVEGALAAEIAKTPHHLLADDIRYHLRGDNESPIGVEVTCDVAIAGLPCALIA